MNEPIEDKIDQAWFGGLSNWHDQQAKRQKIEDAQQPPCGMEKRPCRKTTGYLMEHFPVCVALLVESFIMEDRDPGESFYDSAGCEHVINGSDREHRTGDIAFGHWESAMSGSSEDELNEALRGACLGDNDHESFMIACELVGRGATDFNSGLNMAISAKNIRYIMLMKMCGANMNLGLFQAACDYDIEMCKLMLHLGATNTSAMFIGARKARFDMIATAIAHGAVPDGIAMGYAGEGCDWGIILLFNHLGVVHGPAIYHACKKGHLDIVKRFVDIGYDFPFVLNLNLHAVCTMEKKKPKHFAVIKYLIQTGADECKCGRSMADHELEVDRVLEPDQDTWRGVGL